MIKSLPADIWQSFGESGWGPHGKHAFMEFDYGTVARQDMYADDAAAGHFSDEVMQQETVTVTSSPRARELSADGSCAWIEYYANQAILDKVGRLYDVDYDTFGWYSLNPWKARLEECLKRRQ